MRVSPSKRSFSLKSVSKIDKKINFIGHSMHFCSRQLAASLRTPTTASASVRGASVSLQQRQRVCRKPSYSYNSFSEHAASLRIATTASASVREASVPLRKRQRVCRKPPYSYDSVSECAGSKTQRIFVPANRPQSKCGAFLFPPTIGKLNAAHFHSR